MLIDASTVDKGGKKNKRKNKRKKETCLLFLKTGKKSPEPFWV
jgi:hypothetical protein